MLVELLIDVVVSFFVWVFSLFPTVTMPTWVTDVGDYLAQGVTAAYGFRHWVPLEALRNSFIFITAIGTTVIVVRVVRILISHFTGGGGAAA